MTAGTTLASRDDPGGRSTPEDPAESAGAAGGDGSAAAGASTTQAPAPAPDRTARLHRAIRRVAVSSGQLLLIVAAVVVLGHLLGRLWVVLLPVVLALLLSTVLWPAARFLRRHSWPPALAAAGVLLFSLATLGGILAVIAPR